MLPFLCCVLLSQSCCKYNLGDMIYVRVVVKLITCNDRKQKSYCLNLPLISPTVVFRGVVAC